MRKLVLSAAVITLIALSACKDNSRNNGVSNASDAIDSLVNEATSAVSNAADSVIKGAKKAKDSTQTALDTTIRENK